MAAYSAKNAPVRYGTTVVTVTKWAVTDETDELETTNMESSGRHECIGGIKKITANLTLNDDGAANLRVPLEVNLSFGASWAEAK